jgi:DNA-binding transcriptional MerR regulator
MSPKKDPGLSIGQLSSRSGCKIPTIRYYEDIGLLSVPARTERGHRLYGEDDLNRLVFILRSRELGFSIEEVRSLIDISTDRDRPCEEIDAIASKHLEETTEKIRNLTAMQEALVDLVDQCRRTTVVECRVIEALSP